MTTPDMYEKITPALGRLYFHEPGSFRETSQPNVEDGEWYLEGEFTVVNVPLQQYNDTKRFYKRRRGNKHGDLGYVFPFLVCSSGYAKRYAKDIAGLTYTPTIMEQFDAVAVRNIYADLISKAGTDLSIDEVLAYLSAFSDTEYDT